MDSKRMIATAKGQATRAATLLKEQEQLDPQDISMVQLKRIGSRLSKAEDGYEEAFESIVEVTGEDEEAQVEFSTMVDSLRERLDHLYRILEVYEEGQQLMETLDYWESLDGEKLRHKVDRDSDELQSSLQAFLKLTRPRKIASSDNVKTLVKTIRTRVDLLRSRGTPSTSSSPPPSGTDDSRPMKQGVKSRTLPLPTYSGDLADWRSFWRRFKDYLSRLPDLTADEQLTFLLECVKEPAATSIIRDGLRNGDPFESVEARLQTRFDQPRRVYTDMALKLKRVPEFSDTVKGTSTCSEMLSKYLNIINKFGDGSASQLVTAFFEAMMDSNLTQEWYRYAGSSDKVPHAEKLIEFLDHRNRLLTSKPVDARPGNKPPSSYSKPPSGRMSSSTKPFTKDKSKSIALMSHQALCKLCNEREHALYYCEAFKRMDVPARRQHINTSNCCFNCLAPGHTNKQCHSRKSCRTCSGKHHSLLHLDEAERVTSATTATATSQPEPTTPPETSLALPVPRPTVILWVCQAVAKQDDKICRVRGIIDPGSTISFITERVVKQMKLRTTPILTEVTGIGATHAGTCKKEAEIQVYSPYEHDSPTVHVRAAVITSIIGDTPSTDLLKKVDTSFTNSLNLSDPHFNAPGGIDLLLGQDVLRAILRDGVVRSNKNDLYAINTIFGWVVGGCCDSTTGAASTHICCHATTTSTVKTDQLLKAFWESEEPPKASTMSEEEKQALSYFKETHSRHQDGRYEVRVPKQTTATPLGDSRRQAVQRYIANKRSLERRGNWPAFAAAVKEYSELGHAELVPVADLHKPSVDVYYMPMHGVMKESSTSTKLRVVFDASAATSTGISLNDSLLPGPTNYPLLTDVLVRFRLPRIGLSADISKMFREVALHQQDRDLHRFVMEDDSGVLRDWRMVRLTFGVTCSPFLAVQVLRQLAEDYMDEFPDAARAILTSFYVDDFLSGADTMEEAAHLQRSLTELLSKAQMTLRKWRTNHTELRSSIPSHMLETEESQLIQAPSQCHKTLGVHWRTTTDTLHVATPQLSTDDQPTKRQVLSDVARTFDVLGWFTPVTISLKILLQRIWSLGLDWDELIPSELINVWERWRNELHLMTDFPIPRCYFQMDKTTQSLSLHGFCDASQMAMAAVVYLRIVYSDISVSVKLVLAKSRVSPVKPLTIPKLELAAAVLLTKLLSSAMTELSIDLSAVHAWSDSTITLGWIRTNPAKLKTYVANRVVQIVDVIPPVSWRHVPTATNPADVASRGTSASELCHHPLWWHGPDWLHLAPESWPVHRELSSPKLPELKSYALTVRADMETPEREQIIKQFSSFNHCVNVLSYMLRFISGCKKKRVCNTHRQLLVEEVLAAEEKLFHLHQTEYFFKEIKTLKSSAPLSTSNPLCALSPYLDSSGLMRVGGRLQQADIPYQQKHPIILCRRSHLALMLIRHLHTSNHHAGPTMMMGLLSQRFYMAGARTLVRAVTHNCTTCRKQYARVASQQMGQLPTARVLPSPPFTRTGTDFAGPLLLKKGHTRKPVHVKGYICIFVCLATRAVHLELVMDLTTEAFLAAFRRFSARRGCPTEVLSDNGTNYVGANRELARIYDVLTNEQSIDTICHFFSNARIKWSFIPGRAPHFGGIWEASVKSAKTVLRKLVGSHILSVEECISVLTDIEATMNSRPMCILNSLPEDGVEVLTPGHFLVGRPLLAPPQLPSDHLHISTKRRWNLCQKIASEFWSRWSSDYLQLLQKRHKWKRRSDNIKIGEVVLLKDDELFLRTWPMAVVTAVHPGQDGLVRAVTVRTNKGTYRRPIQKLVPLFDSSEEDRRSSPCPREDVQATPTP